MKGFKVLLWAYWMLPVWVQSQHRPLAFDHITTEDGLSQSHVEVILRDHQGLMWFGTFNGLNCYNGYDIKVYKHETEDPGSVSGNFIAALYEDKEQNLWVGVASSGVNKYDREKNEFVRYKYDKADPEGIQVHTVKAIFQDREGFLWFGSDEGLERFDPSTGSFTHFRHESQDPHSLGNNNIFQVTEDTAGNVWMISNHVLSRFDFERQHFINYYPFENTSDVEIQTLHIADNDHFWIGTYGKGLYRYVPERNDLISIEGFERYRVMDINENEQGQILIGTESAGFFIFDPVSQELTVHNQQWDNPKGINNNSVHEIYIDNKGITWLGTHSGGVNYFSKHHKPFIHIERGSSNSGLRSENVLAIGEEKEGQLWIGTDGGSLHRYDRATGEVMVMDVGQDPGQISGSVVRTLEITHSGDLWMGTYMGGVNKLDLQTGQVTNGYRDPVYWQPKNTITYIYETPDHELLISSDRIYRYNRGRHNFEEIFNPEWGARVILEDGKGYRWIGTFNGLYCLREDGYEFYNTHEGDQPRISDGGINTLYEDSRGNLWVGTSNGLNLFQRSSETFRSYKESEGLSDNVIKAILEDGAGNLWISTNNGISKFIDAVTLPEEPEIQNYGVEDGLQGKEFNSKAAFKNAKGELFFGGINGLNIFHPSEIKDNPHPPEVIISDFRIFNKEVPIGEKGSPLKKHISTTESLLLSYRHSVISFEFAALNFINPQENEYAYMLEGFEKDWNYVGTQRSATYTNLDPGKYTLRVKAANNDGVWNETGIDLRIIIEPPWWETLWFRVLMVVVLAGGTIALFRLRLATIKRQKRLLEQTVLQRTAELQKANRELEKQKTEISHQADKLQEADKVKSRFFSNITHEFRTPLTLIISPLEKLLTVPQFDEHMLKKHFQLMLRNAQRLLRLINQLLDISKVEAGNLPLEVAHGDIIKYIREIARSFHYLAERYNIHYRYESNVDHAYAFFDQDKVEKIGYNLLSNAFKFTPEGGRVTITFEVLEQQDRGRSIIIDVKDSGPGISEKDLDKIFDRFYQVDTDMIDSGSGIGLALTKRLVELHMGKISVWSNVRQGESGTTFRVELPIDKEAYPSTRLVEDFVPNEDRKLNFALLSTTTSRVTEGETATEKADEKAPLILIVEDNKDVRDYITDELSVNYKVASARDGKEGWEKAQKLIPDLIISDLMMPGLDGISLCEKIKTTEITAHIPVILLTAKKASESRLAGIETGADDYVTKPFNILLLQLRINNLINSRRLLKKRFSTGLSLEPKDIAVTSADEQFLTRALEIIDSQLDDSSFNVMAFARQLGMSRTQLYRKFQGLTGQSVKDFVRTYKLKYAARLLSKQAFSVSEVGFKIGFKNHSSFTRAFHKQFGISPSDYVEKNGVSQ